MCDMSSRMKNLNLKLQSEDGCCKLIWGNLFCMYLIHVSRAFGTCSKSASKHMGWCWERVSWWLVVCFEQCDTMEHFCRELRRHFETCLECVINVSKSISVARLKRVSERLVLCLLKRMSLQHFRRQLKRGFRTCLDYVLNTSQGIYLSRSERVPNVSRAT